MAKKSTVINSGKGFDFSFMNEKGFSALKSNMKAYDIFKGFAADFSTGKKPMVKTLQHGKGKRYTVNIMVDAKSVYVHVADNETGKTFCRKAPKINSAEKQFRNVKGMLRHLFNKTNLAVSNILQTRICNEIVKLK